MENSGRSQSNVEEAHKSAPPDEKRTAADILAGDQRAEDRYYEKDKGDDRDHEGVRHAGNLEEVLCYTY